MSLPQILNILGLVLNLSGVLLLFRYGMPYRIRSEDAFLTFEARNENDVKADKLYGALGFAGLLLVIAGTVAQVAATLSF